MKNKLYILTLIPMALAMTSFNLATQSGRIELSRTSPEFDTTEETGAETKSPDTGTEAVETEQEEPKAAQQDDAIALSEAIERVRDVVQEISSITVDLNNNNQDDTTLRITNIQSKSRPNNSISRRSDGDEKIVLTIESETDRNVGLEAQSGLECDCDTKQQISIELTLADLGLTGEDADLNSLDPGKLKDALRNHSPTIIAKIQEQRTNQHDQRIAAKDCDRKENSRQKLNCLIERVKESSGDKKEELVAQIEDEMRNLVYSDEHTDQRTFASILRRLRGDSSLTALRRKLEEHQDIKEEIDEHKEETSRLAHDISEFDEMYRIAQLEKTSIDRNGFRHPQDWQRYIQLTQQMSHAENMLLGAQGELNTMRSSFSGRFHRLMNDSRGIFNRNDISAARNYAFPRNRNANPLLARTRRGVYRNSTPLLGDSLLTDRFQTDPYLPGMRSLDVPYSLRRPRLNTFSHRRRNPLMTRGQVRGRRHNFGQRYFESGRTIARPRSFQINNRLRNGRDISHSRRGRPAVGRGRARI